MNTGREVVINAGLKVMANYTRLEVMVNTRLKKAVMIISL